MKRHTASIGSVALAVAAILTAAILTAGMLTVGMQPGVAGAAPEHDGPIHYRVAAAGQAVTINVTGGSVTTSGDALSLRSRSGQERLRLPLTFTLNGVSYRLAAAVTPTSARLAPIIDPTAAHRAASNNERFATPRTKDERDRLALAMFNEQVRATLTIATIVGVVLGAIVGGVTGCLLGLPLFGVGCIAGFAGGVTAGSAIGALLGGGGGLIGFGIQYWNTINSPFTPPKTTRPKTTAPTGR